MAGIRHQPLLRRPPFRFELRNALLERVLQQEEVLRLQSDWNFSHRLPYSLRLIPLRDIHMNTWCTAAHLPSKSVSCFARLAVNSLRGSRQANRFLALQAELASESITGVCLSTRGHYAVACSADGTLSLLDMRKSGHSLAEFHSPQSLRCCQTDWDTVLAGSSNGEVWLPQSPTSPFLGHASPPFFSSLFHARGFSWGWKLAETSESLPREG